MDKNWLRGNVIKPYLINKGMVSSKTFILMSIFLFSITLASGISWSGGAGDIIDTNATTACTGGQVLFGNGSCGTITGGGGGVLSNLTTELFTGLNLTGTDGNPNRELTTASLSSAGGTQLVFLDSFLLRETDDYSISGEVVTFIIRTWDSQRIAVSYVTGGNTLKTETFLGSDASGSDADPNRVISTADVSSSNGKILVFLDSQLLREVDDYSITGNDITITLRLFDSQRISVSYI